MRDIQYKSFATQFTASDEGIVEAWVSVFGNVDSALEVVDFGAYTETLKKSLPSVAFQHNWERGIGITLEAEEVPAGDPRLPENIKDLGGLYCKGQLNLDTQDGRETFSNLKLGVYKEFSVGYIVEADEIGADGYRHLKKIDLIEWSPVLRGANPSTSTIGVKGIAFEEPTDPSQIEAKNDTKDMNEILTKIMDALNAAKNAVDELAALPEMQPKEDSTTSAKTLDIAAMTDLINQAIAAVDALIAAAADPNAADPATASVDGKIGRAISRNTKSALDDIRSLLDQMMALVQGEQTDPNAVDPNADPTAANADGGKTISLDDQIELEKMFVSAMIKSLI